MTPMHPLKMADRRQAFLRNPVLQRFALSDVRPTGRILGVGSYGSVEELKVNGVVCAGKRLHEALAEQGNAEIVHKYQVMPLHRSDILTLCLEYR